MKDYTRLKETLSGNSVFESILAIMSSATIPPEVKIEAGKVLDLAQAGADSEARRREAEGTRPWARA